MSLILSEPTRKDKLKGWLCAHRLTYAAIGAHLGLAASSLSLILNGDTARPERVAQLRELGIPEELLPEPLYIPPGPKRKAREA
jgi:hypothetical protein